MARGWHGLEQAPELPISGLPQAPVTLTGSKTSLPRAPTQVTLDLGHGEKTFKGFPGTMSFRASLSVCTWSWSHAGFPFPCSSFKNSPSFTLQKQDTLHPLQSHYWGENISQAPKKDDSKIYFGQSFLEERSGQERLTLGFEVL